MTRRLFLFLAFLLLASPIAGLAQTPTPTPTPSGPNTLVGQITNATFESFAGAISGDGRFVVFESRGNLATENPRNEDGNIEIFLFDYAQRRIFQITDTKSLLFNLGVAASGTNIRVEIANRRPTISQNGRWIAFSSNATSSTPAVPRAVPNPGSFDANCVLADGSTANPCPTATPNPTPSPTPTPSPSPTPTPSPNPLADDANLEMWLYQIPAYAQVDLSAGDELPVTNLSGGTFTQVTNTPPSRLPSPATSTTLPFIANDQHEPAINDDGTVLAFTSNRNLVTCVGNLFPNDDNDEIFTYVQGASSVCGDGSGPGIRQITKTVRGPLNAPVYNKNASISGLGDKLVFASTGDDPVDDPNSTTNLPDGASNAEPSRNEEIFYVTLNALRQPMTARQITATTPTGPGGLVNILDLGRRMSRDGRYVAFDSFADLANENSGANYLSFATYVFDADAPAALAFRRVGPRSNADSGAPGGDVQHFPGFTDYNPGGTPRTVVLTTRQNIKTDGTIPATASEGLNPDENRPVQIYAYTLDQPSASATFTRLTKFPISSVFLASTQPLPSDTSERLAFNLSLTELGTGNPDLGAESYYLLRPDVTSTATGGTHSFFTGASRLPVAFASPSPTPTPTATPTPTPTASPTPTPTPVTPSQVFGLAPGMLAILNLQQNPPVVTRTAIGSLQRSFTLPIELSGVSLSINGAAAGLKSVSTNEIVFVLPPALASSVAGTTATYVLNNNGVEIRGEMKLVPARPDIFTNLPAPGPGGRADLRNVTNRVHTTEPFTVTTIQIRGGVRVPSRLRLRLTGVANLAAGSISIRIGGVTIPPASILTGGILEAPGVYTVDFQLPSTLNMAGDQPIVVIISGGGTTFESRLDDTAPRVFIL